jgi:hypothetical protein
MVVKGDFKVELVNAKTKVPFREHTSRGKVYVEVEPGSEYFILVQAVGGDNMRLVRSTCSVDGTSLGFHTTFCKSNGKQYAGLWSLADGIGLQTALRFELQESIQNACSGDDELSTGSIQVNFFEAIVERYVESPRDFASQPLAKKTINCSNVADKVVTSAQGGHSEQVSFKKQKQIRETKAGKLLESVCLHYCTVPSLVAAGVLEKPFNAARERLRRVRPAKPLDSSTGNRRKSKPPEIVRREALIVNGQTLAQAQEVEFFDLISDEEEDGSNNNNTEGNTNAIQGLGTDISTADAETRPRRTKRVSKRMKKRK